MDRAFDVMQLALLAAAFLAAALALEGLVLLWNQTRSPAVQRLRRRLKAWLPEAEADARLLGRGPDAPRRAAAGPVRGAPLMSRLDPSLGALGQWLQQAGSAWTPATLLGLSAACALLAFLAVMWLPVGGPAPATLAAGLAGAAPWLWWRQRRQARLHAMVAQLPDALDLMSRAMRSGHAFSTALQMVGEDGPAPLAHELRRVAEQVAYGVEADDAFDALARRVPLDDVRFFVMAVRLQRQTGGQLAEVLGNIAHLVRQRLQLLDQVRVLTAEGRLSARVLAALPPVTAAVLLLIRPEFIALLWTDPAGVRLLQASAALMALGGLWLWRLTRIQV